MPRASLNYKQQRTTQQKGPIYDGKCSVFDLKKQNELSKKQKNLKCIDSRAMSKKGQSIRTEARTRDLSRVRRAS